MTPAIAEAVHHARTVRERLQNPRNAVADIGIDLKRPKAVPIPEAVIEPPCDVAFEQADADFGPKIVKRRRHPRIEEVCAAVGRYFGIGRTELLTHRRTQHLVYVRHVAMYLCHVMTLRSYPYIAEKMDGRDHTTVIHGVRKIQAALSANNPETVRDVDNIRQTIIERYNIDPSDDWDVTPPENQYCRACGARR